METKFFLSELRGEQVKVSGDGINVSLGWRYKEYFPATESRLPEFDTLAIFHVAEDDTGQEKIIAVDAVYCDKDGFKSARLFGKAENAPLPGRASQK